MSRKQEIKVYLPDHMVGQLESRKKQGSRSRFIEKAIHSRLADLKNDTLSDYPLEQLMWHIQGRLIKLNKEGRIETNMAVALGMYFQELGL